MTFPAPGKLVLASGSRYRKALLEQLGLRFSISAPDIDESPRPGESPIEIATRLAAEKTRAVAALYPESLVIGSDQVATLDGRTTFGKPASHDDAVLQLTRMSGRTARFHTAVNVLNTSCGRNRCALVSTEVQYRELSAATIEAYLRRDTPYDCAGSARIESLGIALVKHVRSEDPTALLGLPLIALTQMLFDEGLNVVEHCS